MTQDALPILGEAAHHFGERLEVTLSRDENVELLVAEEVERDTKPPRVIPARSPIGGDAAHLAAPQREST